MRDLGTLGGVFSFAAGINPSGQVAGTSYTADAIHAFVWEKGVMTDIGTLGGDFVLSQAAGINPAGEVVGTSSMVGLTNSRPFVWSNGTMTALPTFNDGFGRALSINPSGQIVGFADTEFGTQQPTLWSRK